MNPLQDLEVVVTGASSGIGASIAFRLAQDGYRVLTIQRGKPRFDPKGLKGTIDSLQVDLSKPDEVNELTDVLKLRRIGFLVNNAGANRPGTIDSVTDDDLDYVWQLNVKTPIALIKSALVFMRKNKFGRIVNISSRAILGKTERIAYASSKMGLVGLTRSLSLEVASDGITVNAVAPGPVATELFNNGHPEGSDKRSMVIQSVPLRRVGTPEDIAHAVSFFLSPNSGFITGQTLFVCGGVSISGSGGK